MNRIQRLAQDTPRSPRRAVPGFANGGHVAFGSRGLDGLRDMIPKMQAMGYPQAAAPAPAPAADPRGVAGLKAMIPRVESMGYQQASAAPPQHFAEGGFVQRVKQVFGMDPERNARVAAYKAQSAAERLAGAPAPAPVPQAAISGYNGMTATQRREKEAGLKNGGHVRGPGTGTSDSIPARLSDGEFVLPADTVRKVGVRRLQDLVHDTHKPVKAEGKPGHFVGGGLADTDEWMQQMNQQRSAHEQAGRALAQTAAAEAEGAAAAATQRVAPPVAAPAAAGGQPVPAPTQAPPQPAASAEAPRSLDSKVASIPTGGQTAPAADGSQNSFSNTEVGRNLTNTLSAVPGLGGLGQVAATGGAISGGINAASRLLNNTAALGAAGVAAPGIVAAASPPAPQPGADPAPRTLSSVAGLSPTTESAASSFAPTTGNVTRVGNSYSGGNVTGDVSIPGGPRNGGQISPQNMSAAERLAGNSQAASEARLGLGQRTGPGSGPVEPGSFTGGFTGVIGSTSTQGNMLGRSPEQQRRDAEVSASSITNTRKWGGPDAANSAAMTGYRAALQQDSNITQNEAAAGLETTRQGGANQRASISARRDDMANALDQRRLGLQETAAGYQNRSADRLERVQQDMENAATPEARMSARERLMGLAGKTDNEWRLQVTPTTKNPDGSTTEGSVVRYNQRTGQAERVDVGQGGRAPAGQRPVGTVSTVNGKSATWNGQQWVPRA